MQMQLYHDGDPLSLNKIVIYQVQATNKNIYPVKSAYAGTGRIFQT